MAENLLAAVKRHDVLNKSWEIKVAEADAFISEVGVIPSEKIIHFWNEMKSDLEAFPHECEPHPCSICSEKASILTMGCIITMTYHDAIDQTSQWIRLYEDDIMARFLHALACYALGMDFTELSTDTVVPAAAVEQPTQESSETDAVACFTRGLEELEVAIRLIQEVPDDKVYFAKYLRRKAPDLYKQLEQVEFTQDLDPLDIGTPKEENLFDADPIAIPADTFLRMLKQLTAQTLLVLDRPQEALPLIEESLQIARGLRDEEALVSVLCTLSRTLLALNRPQEALPVIEEGLQIERPFADKTRIITCLFTLSATLLALNRQEEALPVIEEGLQVARDLGDEESIFSLLNGLSQTLLALNRQEEALSVLEEGLQAARDLGDEARVNPVRVLLAAMLLDLNRQEEAFPLMRESLEYEMTLEEQ